MSGPLIIEEAKAFCDEMKLQEVSICAVKLSKDVLFFTVIIIKGGESSVSFYSCDFITCVCVCVCVCVRACACMRVLNLYNLQHFLTHSVL